MGGASVVGGGQGLSLLEGVEEEREEESEESEVGEEQLHCLPVGVGCVDVQAVCCQRGRVTVGRPSAHFHTLR